MVVHPENVSKYLHCIFILILGEFGIVYKATLDGCQGNCSEIVAVKTLKGASSVYVIVATLSKDWIW